MPGAEAPQSGRDSASGSQSGQTQGSTPGTQSASGTQPGRAGQSSGSNGASTAQGSGTQSAGAGQAGTSSQVGGSAGSGNYSLDNLPGGLGDSGTGPQTSQERAAVLNGALNRGYEDFDGVILAERARAQAQANAARNTEIPGDSGGGASSGTGAGGQPIIISSRGTGPSGAPQGSPGVGGGTASSREQAQTFPPPEDIPSGRDDDIVARQLREAAMSEPDPELREALWDEYRKYTGIGN